MRSPASGSARTKLAVFGIGVTAVLLACLYGLRLGVRPSAERDPSGAASEMRAPSPELDGGEPTERGALAPSTDVGHAESTAGRAPPDVLPSLGALDVVVLSTSSRRGCTHVPVRIQRLAPGREPDLWAATDEQGRVSFERLRPGTWFAECLGERPQVAVEPARRAVLEISLADERGLEGVVLDQDDAPIAGAEVWLSAIWNSLPPIASAVADAEGRFAVTSTGKATCFGARAAGYAPSTRTFLNELPDRRAVIRLHKNGSSIRGRVRDPESHPVAGAKIEMIDLSGRVPHTAASDESGEFRFASVPDGELSIAVAAGSFQVWSTKLRPEPERELSLHVDLARGGRATGVVRSADGQSLEGVRLVSGEITDLLAPSSISGPDGAYLLEGLPSGTIHLMAQAGEKGRDSTTVSCEEECSIRWDPVIGRGLSISGVVAGENGLGLSNLLVVGFASQVFGQSHTDDQGRFVLADCPSSACRLEVRDAENMTIGSAKGVLGGTTGVRIVCRTRNTRIHGTVVDVQGRAVAGANVMFLIRDRSTPFPGAEAATDGSFTSPLLLPGDYEVSIFHPAYLNKDVDVLGLLAEELREIGEIRLESSCSILLLCRTDDARLLDVQVLGSDGDVLTQERVAAASDPLPLKLDRLPPSELQLRILDRGSEVARRSFSPRVDEIQRIEIRVPPRSN